MYSIVILLSSIGKVVWTFPVKRSATIHNKQKYINLQIAGGMFFYSNSACESFWRRSRKGSYVCYQLSIKSMYFLLFAPVHTNHKYTDLHLAGDCILCIVILFPLKICWNISRNYSTFWTNVPLHNKQEGWILL